MKKIKLLRVLSGILLAGNIAYTGYAFINYFRLDSPAGSSIYRLLSGISAYTLSMPALVLIFLSLNRFIQRGYFNTGSAKGLKWAGVLLILQSLLGPVLNYHTAALHDALGMIMYTYSEILPLCFGIALLVIADVIIRGANLNSENQLTI